MSAETVGRIEELYQSGLSVAAIARRLNREAQRHSTWRALAFPGSQAGAQLGSFVRYFEERLREVSGGLHLVAVQVRAEAVINATKHVRAVPGSLSLDAGQRGRLACRVCVGLAVQCSSPS